MPVPGHPRRPCGGEVVRRRCRWCLRHSTGGHRDSCTPLGRRPRRPAHRRARDGRTGCATSRCCRRGPPGSADWPDWVPPDVRDAFVAAGIGRPWQHQAAAADAAHAGQHVVLATGTASGKSLAYQLPALAAIRTVARRPGRAGRRRALPRAHQGAGPRPARPPSPGWASTSGPRPTTATARASSGSGRATSASTCSPTPTCCTARCCPGTPGGRRSSRPCSTSWSTSATTTAASSGRTSRTCCAGCAGCARCTARRRPSSWPPRRSPTRRSRRAG